MGGRVERGVGVRRVVCVLVCGVWLVRVACGAWREEGSWSLLPHEQGYGGEGAGAVLKEVRCALGKRG